MCDGGHVLRVHWHDGAQARFHAIWLRDNAQDAATRAPANGQRLIAIGDIPAQTWVADADLTAEGGVRVHFAPENKTVEFTAAWLRQHCYDRPADTRRGRLPAGVQTWDGAFGEGLPRAAYEALMDDPEALRAWLAGVARYGVGRVHGGPLASGSLTRLIGRFGFVRETHYGRWFEVKTEVEPVNLAYTRAGLQAHTDNPYRDPVPTLQLLYCLQNDAEGGESLIVDGFHAVQLLAREDPTAFELLSRYCARFEYHAPGAAHLQARRPMIELAPDGELIAVRFNNRSLAAVTDVPFEHMADYYSAYRRLAAIIERPALAVRFKLAPGDAFLVDNTRVLHARTAYTAAGTRWLQGCYADRDGLLSTLALLNEARE